MPATSYLLRIDEEAELDEETVMYRITVEPVADPCYAVNFRVIELSRWATSQPAVVLEGYVKWDGCMDLTTAGHFHLCDPRDATRIVAKLIQAAYAGAYPLFGSSDYPLQFIPGMREDDTPV
jgi:hypothetical protein